MEEEQNIRIRSPGRGEVLGIVESMLGSNRLMVRCQDDKMRICRIPGSMRKRIWMREGDAVIVKPWDIQGDRCGDVIFKYTSTQAGWLRKRGILKISY
jgi:translation initiation factor 1A